MTNIKKHSFQPSPRSIPGSQLCAESIQMFHLAARVHPNVLA
jgi:hypothetical protein